MIHSLQAIVEGRFLNPDIAAQVAETSRNVIRTGGEICCSTWTVDAFVKEVRAADPDPETSRQIQFERIRERNKRSV